MMLVHVGCNIPVVPMAQGWDVVKEHIWSLKAKLVKPAVFGNDGWHIVVGFHTHDVVGGKSRHSRDPFLEDCRSNDSNIFVCDGF